MKGNIRPVQKPHMPMLVAGAGELMLKLAARDLILLQSGRKSARAGRSLQMPRWSKRSPVSKKLLESAKPTWN